jgi:regulation of enolase protein 1 (concanavalin A-like superfamily)
VPKTDFWQTTSYGFVHDNGHFASMGSIEASLDGKWPSFEFTVGFEGEYESLYDQAGLMLRVDAHNWLKTGVEYVDGKRQASVVITRHGRSDWNVVPLDTTARASGATPPTVFWVRLRGGDDGSVAVYFCDTLKPSAAPATCPPREAFTLMRLANFVDATTAARARASQEV